MVPSSDATSADATSAGRSSGQAQPAGQPVGLRPSGPPETVLDLPDPDLAAAIRAAQLEAPGEVATQLEAIVARWPRSSLAWAAVGDAATTTVAAYAAYRVGYHRGLDQLRGSGWKGSGYVRWEHEGNRGFLRCVAGLQRSAAAIGETDEEERCALFLRQLDPSWPPAGEPGLGG